MSIDALIEKARRGDEPATDALCRHFEPFVSRYVSQHMGEGARRWTESGDVVQQVLFEVMRGLHKLPENADEAELHKRLQRTASTRLIDAVRRRRRDFGASTLPEVAWDVADSQPSNGPVTQADDRRWIAELASRLPEPDGTIVRLCALDGFSYADAALRLELTAEAVRKRYERLRAALARKLASRADER